MERWLAERFPGARWETPGGGPGVLVHRVRLPGRGAPLPCDSLFLDLETLGFVGRPIFLIGLLVAAQGREGEIVQILARDYSEEEAMLRHFAERYGPRPRWVTFNGKSFDLPSLQLRCAYHRLPRPSPQDHVDLLHLARRLFRGVFPDCRLKTLEQRICGRHRGNDLNGSEVPDAYHRFVREEDPRLVEPILRHNRDDLVTLAELHQTIIETQPREREEES